MGRKSLTFPGNPLVLEGDGKGNPLIWNGNPWTLKGNPVVVLGKTSLLDITPGCLSTLLPRWIRRWVDKHLPVYLDIHLLSWFYKQLIGAGMQVLTSLSGLYQSAGPPV